jgi:hypothetical protein
MEPIYKVIAVGRNGTYERIRISKDVIFDTTIDFTSDDEALLPTDMDFATANPEGHPATDTQPQRQPKPEVPTELLSPPLSHEQDAEPEQETEFDKLEEHYDTDGNQLYWYNYTCKNHEYPLAMVETSHYLLAMPVIRDKRIPRSYIHAWELPLWRAAIIKEKEKFNKNICFKTVPFVGQHLVPMMWLFSIKTDGTLKARLVGRGDLMIPWIDFDPDSVYCGNVSACGIKIFITIAAFHKYWILGGDLEGAYLVTRANPEYPVFIKTPQGYDVPPGQCIQAVGNLYGFPPAGQNFSKEFDKCVKECGYENTPWDLKLFFKWVNDIPLLLIAHSDDFRWCGPKHMFHEWDLLVATFEKHKYKVTDATDKEFVGIRITRDNEGNIYMDQERMINEIIKEMNMTGSKDEKLPYPVTGESLSKIDNATDVQKADCSKYPYRRVVGQLMYGMVHTMPCIMYALNVLSRYCNNPGPRHIEFLKHLLRYIKYTSKDRLMFCTHDGPTDLVTMTAALQLSFQCDADLAGNLDNKHSQTSYLGYLGGQLICWCSTDQGSVSTSTAESEIKAVNHTLKKEVIANRGILNRMGWKQEPTVIEEDNAACVFASKALHFTRNLRHLDLSECWLKEKVADNTCVLKKVESRLNNSDIGTKRVPQYVFNALTNQLVDRSQRTNL